MKQFFGKYRGKVTSSQDPENLGRIQVTVPAVLGEGIQSWAMPCTPYAGKDIGLFTVPPVGSNIWVEFEGGDTDYPIWSGCFWGKGELPQNAQVAEPDKVQVFRTQGITCTLSNLGDNKGITLEVKEPVVQRPLTMFFNADGIKLSNNDETVIRIKADAIELDNRENSTITIAVESIQLKERSVEIKLTPAAIEITNTPSNIKLTTSAIELSNAPSSAKLSASGVEMSNVTAKLQLSPGTSELSNSAASIKLSPVSVNINNGALEVI